MSSVPNDATPSIRSLATLEPGVADRVAELADACTRVDGIAPLNEQAMLTLNDDHIRDGIAHVIAEDAGRLIGYAQLDSSVSDPASGASAVAQFMVDPDHRRRGVAWQLAAAVGFDIRPGAAPRANERHRQGQRIALWSFGHLPAARAWARRYHIPATRQLLVMARPASEPIDEPTFPDGFTVRPFAEDDLDELLAVNAAAFAHHPEQGQMSALDVRARMAEDWFDPAGFLVLEHRGRVVGFHWTKQHSAHRGEVYVIAVHPDVEGRGLGRRLLNAGMRHLAARGVEEIILYVEGDLERVVGLYRSSGFRVINTDVLYRTTG